MPYIDAKLTGTVTLAQREVLKNELGRAIALMNKPESFLMIGFQDNYDLYFGGNKLEKGAYVAVRLFGNASSDAYDRMTAAICKIYEEAMEIPAANVYVTYIGVKDWGWNGGNF